MPRHVQVEALFRFAIAPLKVYQISHELATLLFLLNVSPSHAWIAYGMGKQPTKARGSSAPLQITTTWPRASCSSNRRSLWRWSSRRRTGYHPDPLRRCPPRAYQRRRPPHPRRQAATQNPHLQPDHRPAPSRRHGRRSRGGGPPRGRQASAPAVHIPIPAVTPDPEWAASPAPAGPRCPALLPGRSARPVPKANHAADVQRWMHRRFAVKGIALYNTGCHVNATLSEVIPIEGLVERLPL